MKLYLAIYYKCVVANLMQLPCVMLFWLYTLCSMLKICCIPLGFGVYFAAVNDHVRAFIIHVILKYS